MYCPQCATQTMEAAKFCRVCGTNLEAVNLALQSAERTAEPEDSTGKRRRRRAARRNAYQAKLAAAAAARHAGNEAGSPQLVGGPLVRRKNSAPAKPLENYDDWLAREANGKGQVIHGSVLLGVSALIALAAMALTRGSFAWFPIWAVFFGWLACWGSVSLAGGLGKRLEAKAALRRLGSARTESAAPTTGPLIEPSPVQSVTEHTTRQLAKNPNAQSLSDI